MVRTRRQAADGSLARPVLESRRCKKRILRDTAPNFDAHILAVGLPDTMMPAAVPENEYEQERAALIRKNREMLASLQVDAASHGLAAAASSGPKGQSGPNKRVGHKPKARKPPTLVSRKSPRLLSMSASKGENQSTEKQIAWEEGVSVEGHKLEAEGGASEHAGLMEQRTYLKQMGIKVKGIKTDGHFKGWVNPEVCRRFGIAESAQAAWERNGGGRFSLKIDKKSLPSHLLSKGWSTARAHSFTMLKKNPNSYFYRNVQPGEVHAQGEWTEEEHDAFVETARRFGVGDKWGLFASYIPQRVGYQCSSYYRDVIIPSGLVLDARFRINGRGKAVFVG